CYRLALRALRFYFGCRVGQEDRQCLASLWSMDLTSLLRTSHKFRASGTGPEFTRTSVKKTKHFSEIL
ncbi:hypothetical protein FKM82_006767, partial [Ascaphus truei]